MKKKPNHLQIDSITTSRLTIVDDVGVPRIVLSTDKKGVVSTIEFLDDSGERKLFLEVENEGVRICVPSTDSTPGLEICRMDSRCGFGVGGCNSGGPAAFLGQNPNPSLTNSPFKRGQGYLVIRDSISGSQINIPEPSPTDSGEQ